MLVCYLNYKMHGATIKVTTTFKQISVFTQTHYTHKLQYSLLETCQDTARVLEKM